MEDCSGNLPSTGSGQVGFPFLVILWRTKVLLYIKREYNYRSGDLKFATQRMSTGFRRKVNRLKDFEYTNPFIYFVTICTYKKSKTFVYRDTVSKVLKHLEKSADRHNLHVLAYCFMPDHLHLLVGCDHAEGNLLNFVKDFKQKTGYEFKKKHDVNLWQKSFYDHILRSEESVIDLVQYIFDNPVRKGLVKEFKEYPFLGSMLVDLDDIY